MLLHQVSPGKNAPYVVNVVIEVPMQTMPVKYEMDKDTGALFVDRFVSTAMFYPANYGYVPMTLSDDGDPVDVLVMTPYPVISGSVISCRAIGMLQMTDEKGVDNKVLAVPTDKLSPMYAHIKSYEDVPEAFIKQISHFFEHYKDLEANKWARVDKWMGVDEAIKEIEAGIKQYKIKDE